MSIVQFNSVIYNVACVFCSRIKSHQVGYCVRFDELYSAHTAIRFVTDGMLVRETMRDPLLKQYSVIMVFLLCFVDC